MTGTNRQTHTADSAGSPLPAIVGQQKKYSCRHKYGITRSDLQFGTPFLALRRRPAAACTRARVLFRVPTAHSFSYCYAVGALSKAAACRPHRWIQLVEGNRLVASPSRGDAPLRSYSGLNITRHKVAEFVAISSQCRWTHSRAAGVREADPRRR